MSRRSNRANGIASQQVLDVMCQVAPVVVLSKKDLSADRRIHPDSAFLVGLFGLMRLQGVGFRASPESGFRILSMAAQAGDNNAKAAAGAALYRGIGIPADTRKGLRLLYEAGTAGEPTSRRLLGSLASEGKSCFTATFSEQELRTIVSEWGAGATATSGSPPPFH